MISIEKRVLGLLSDQLGILEEDIHPNDDLHIAHGIDSLDAIEILMSVEEEFMLEIPDDVAEKFRTMQHIVDYVRSQQ